MRSLKTAAKKLQFFSTPEGYVEPKNPDNLALGYDYIYQYKDHLGNIRLSYKNVGTASNVDLEIQEENNYYPFGLKHKGYNTMQSAARDHKFEYNGVEFEESLGLNLMEMDWRQYDPAIGSLPLSIQSFTLIILLILRLTTILFFGQIPAELILQQNGWQQMG